MSTKNEQQRVKRLHRYEAKRLLHRKLLVQLALDSDRHNVKTITKVVEQNGKALLGKDGKPLTYQVEVKPIDLVTKHKIALERRIKRTELKRAATSSTATMRRKRLAHAGN